jgi:hypothetical protein
LLEKIIGETLQNIDIGIVLGCDSKKTKEINSKVYKWNYIKLRSFFTAKKIAKRVKRQL